jgi:DNA/RNA endonuclease G (NUC1)/fibronectin type 3 domain-containing protein
MTISSLQPKSIGRTSTFRASRALTLTARALFAALLLLLPVAAHAQVSLTTLGSPATQSFDTLSNTAGSTTNNLTIPGWSLTETGGGARDNEQYAVDTGGSTTGDMYSYGAAASTDRALGQLRSGTLIPVFGAAFTNNTGTTITSLQVAYTGEEWRLGTAGRAITDRMDFQYSTDATSLTTGVWTDVDSLDFNTPDNATVGAKNGNAAADRTALAATIGTLSIPNGATFWIRWNDIDATGADDGLAVDDFSLTPLGAAPNTAPSITPPSNPITTVAQDAAPFTVGLSGSDDNSVYNWSATPGTGVSTVTVTGGQGTANVTYTVTLTAGFSGTATFTATLTDNVNTAVNQAVNITVVAPPAAPTGLGATAGTSHVALSWSSVSGATSYNVKRSTTMGSGYATINSPGTNSYDDTSAVDGTQYFYVVSAVGAGGEGANSSEVTATPMAAPTGVTATPGNSHVQLAWTAVTGATGYNVKRSTTMGSGYATINSPATNSFDDTTAANGTTYYYVVTAINATGESLPSSEVSGLPAAPGILVISQAYGGAGCGTAGCSTYKNDFIEIFNRGGSPVSVNGWSVQYAAATGTAWQVTSLPNVSIGPGQYFLVAESAGANGVNVLPTPDATGTIAMSATAAKLALVSSTVALTGACPAGASILDFVGFGATANCSETAPAPAPSTTNAILRAAGGCTDAGNNSTDFAAGPAAPRNTAAPTHNCAGGNTPPTITPPGNPAATVNQNAPPFPVNISGNDDNGSYNWSATAGTGVSTVTVTGGQGTSTATFTVTLVGGFTGTATFTAFLTDNINPPVAQPVNILVNAVTPPPPPTGLMASAGNNHVVLSWTAAAGATGYNVKRSTTMGSGYATIASPGTNSFDDLTAVNGTTYFYVVSGTNAGGEGGNSNEASATPAPVPNAPTGLVATPGNAHVALAWNSVPGATSYTVKRSTTSGTGYTNIATPGTNSYDDVTAVNGTTYFYVVSATNATGEGTNSAEVSATPNAPPATPAGLAATPGPSHVQLNWTATPGATSYNVKRSTTMGSGYATIASPATNSYDDLTAASGTTYYYVVSAVNAAGESGNSTEVSATPTAAANLIGVVISQLYGGNGNAYSNDYIELFNPTGGTVNISGYSVQYGSATGQFGSVATNVYTFPAATTIGAGRYLSVKFGTAGAGLPTTTDLDGGATSLNMSGTSGKVAFVTTGTALGCGATATPCLASDARIVDLVAYGTANNGEGGTTVGNGAAISASAGPLRNFEGCQDTNNNNNDFIVATTATGLAPRTAATAQHICGPMNLAPTITAPANPIATVNENASPFTVNLTGNDDGGIYNWSATPVSGITSVSVSAGQGTANVTYLVTLQTNYYGTATFTASLSDGVNTTATRTVNITVTRDTNINHVPTIVAPANPAATVAQNGGPVNVNLTGNDDNNLYTWSATPGAGVTSAIVTAGQGTANVTYNVTIQAGFIGTATFTASLSDGVNPATTQTVNIGVSPSGSSVTHVVISQVYPGGGNAGATYSNDFVELYNPTGNPINTAGWTLQYSAATNTGNFSGIEPLGGTIGPGEYFLIALAGGAVGGPLPPANIDNNSTLNMSGTSGKIALVGNASALTGSCGSLLTDPDIIDFVGYGPTSNCSEGGSNAPQPTNAASSLFRANNGDTDTNNNGSDFANGAVNPRRTAPIQENGPTVVNVDPSNNDSIAPRDANLVITFSEAVDVSGTWFGITCVTSGTHNSATFSPASASSIYTIVPNVNFIAGEQCTATLFKDFIRDTDTDDSNPGTDFLPADYSWTFTIASGTAPPYPSTVHLTMGNPSGAVADVNVPNNYLMEKPEMALSYNRDKGTPNWVSWHLTDEWVGSLPRNDTFRADPDVLPTWFRVLGSSYSGSGFDRGHMMPNADRDKETSVPINQATFLMTNMIPQAPDNNQGPWANLEGDLRLLLPGDELYIVSGPAGQGGTGSNGFANTIAGGNVVVPSSTWKCALVLPKASGNDVARVTASTRTICVIMPNIQGIRNDDWHIYLKSVDQVETLSGYDLFANVPDAIENAIEGGVNGTNPPGAANGSVSVNEDGSQGFTLDAVSPTNAAMTYTIISPATHGMLTGTGANRTYTPVPDFYGSDSFTYRVNDGTADSNTATVTITVLEVNDPPSATDDSKSAAYNTPLTFNASDLTVNDSAGPANENTQTLTVSSVTGTANTHGMVSLAGGQITYTPDSGYSGSASFSYSVCDNGITGGMSAPLCATASVLLNVAAAAPATHFSLSLPASATNGTPFNVTVTALDASNATAIGYTGTVHFTSSSAGTLPADYTFVAGDNGVHTFSVTLTTNGLQTVTATDTVTPSITGSGSTTVGSAPPPPATHFSVTLPAATTTGVAFNVTVTALDATNASVAGYTGTVHFTSSSAGTLPADYTFTGGDAGSHTFSVTLTSTGAQTVTATDTVTASITGTGSTTVSNPPPPPATHFTVTIPANTTAGVAFNATVTALDASNAVVSGYTGTVHFTSSSAGTLPADYTFAAGDSGSHTFSVTLTSPGAQTVTATDTVTASITGTGSTTVASVSATHFSLAAPMSATAGVPFSVTVTALTAANATATGYTGTVHFTSSAPGTLPADYTFTAGDNGVHTFSVTLIGTGSQSVTVTDTVTPSITGSANVSLVCGPVDATITAGAVCGLGQNTASVPNAGAGAIYVWTIANGIINSGNGTNAITFTPSNAAGATLGVTVTAAGGCSASSSKQVAASTAPTATLPDEILSCGGGTITIPVTLTGTAPWSITWSDGLVQDNINSSNTSRTITADEDDVFQIVSVTDAGCSGGPSNEVEIRVDEPIAITTQPVSQIVAKGERADFSVAAAGSNPHYQWYFGPVGVMTFPVGTDRPSYQTWAINDNDPQPFWVKVTNGCGSIQSVQVTASTHKPKHRGTKH